MNPEIDRGFSGTKFSVRHSTEFRYSNWIVGNANTLHLEPRDFLFQKTLGCIVKVLPATRLTRSTDPFGNITHHFEVGTQHQRMVVESQLRVINLPLHISNEGYSAPMETAAETFRQYLSESPWVSLTPEILHAAADIAAPEESLFGKAAAIMRWINTEFSYQPGTTDAETHSTDAFRLRKGVCQDFAHIMIAMCRSLGIPARYASGYIFTGGKNALIGAQASHAWCEVPLPATGWIGFDPTNAVLADHRYIKAAVGRDYGDVAPIHGRYKGSAECTMDVSVSVERL